MSANAPSISITKDVTLPPKPELLKAMQNAEKSPELARYLRQRVHEIIENSRYYKKSPEAMAAAKEIEKAIDEFVQFVEYKFSQREQIWLGDLPETSSFKNMQTGIAEKAASNLADKNYEEIQFDFAISEEGHFVRGYAVPGTDEPLDEGTVESLDQLFNAWLAKKYQIATENGYFFNSDKEGSHIRKLPVEIMEQLLADSAKDFRDFLQESNVSTTLVTRQREYPGEQRLEEERIRAKTQKAIKELIETRKLDEVMEENIGTKSEPESDSEPKVQQESPGHVG
ncbi:substrate of the Dot/Icm secretion system [Legionella gratiana]|uniref:Dot/Icm secretion system substrate n=1 Tax=Legionella gratiana TaxID=45066 RepID=A0A378JE75_9GAMM|nr:hypothetical protein [Legionella gratiana]KTD13588.1 substrate of the Dot/Icm secretion system [Legionella gratiana]STX46184.1 Dot/Icm secretion system substrate [Legionella gratiana]